MISQLYKDYEVLVTFGQGAGIVIRKVFKGKYFVLHRVNYSFIKPDDAVKRGCDYIDSFQDKLQEKFKTMFIEFCQKINKSPANYANTKIDIGYYLKAYKKLAETDQIKTTCENFKRGNSHYGNPVLKRCKSAAIEFVNGKMLCVNCAKERKK